MHHREHDVGDAAAVCVQSCKIGVAVVPEDTIEGMDSLARRASDDGFGGGRIGR